MKKEYLKPEITIININMKHSLLTGSNGGAVGASYYDEETDEEYGY